MSASSVASILSRGLRTRPWWTVPLVWLVSLGLLLAVAAAAAGLGGTLELDRLPQVGTLDYGRDSFGSVAPLDQAFVVDSLGTPFFDRLRAEVGSPTPAPTPRERRVGLSGSPEAPLPVGETAPPDDEFTPRPDLRIEMEVDNASASWGDILEYAITVTNVGTAPSQRMQLRSHVPEHTRLVATPHCGGQTVRVSPGRGPAGLPAICIDLPIGLTAPGAHEIVIGTDGLDAGQTQRLAFRVAVDPQAPQGHRIRNHAHVSADGLPDRTSNEVTTVVR